MSDYNLGTARGRIEVDTSGVSRNIGKAGKDVDGFTNKLSKSGPGLVKAGAAVGSLGVVVAAGFAVAVKSAMDYEHRLAAIQAVSGATAGEMAAISKKALQLGKDTKFSASEAATAIEELVKAGVSIPDVMNGAADSVVALAAAGEIDLPQAATIAANAMNGFGATAKEMPGIADAIAGAANASAIDVSEFGQSLQQVAAVANLAGLSFKDTAVAIAEMGNAGIKGSDAGTSLKSFLSNLIPTTEAQINKFKELGFSAVGSGASMDKLAKMGIKPVSKSYDDVSAAMAKYVEESTGLKVGTGKNNKAVQELGMSTGALKNQFFDATGKAKSLKEMQALLADKTKNMTKEQKLATFNMLFGSDAIRAASVLATNGAAGYDKMAGAMGKVTAAEVAATRQASLSGKMENLKGSLETIGITIGMMLIPALQKLVEWLTGVANWFLNLSEKTQSTIITIVAILGVLSILGGIVLAVAGAIGMLMTALAPIAALIGMTSAVLLGWVAVIAIVIAAVVIIGVLIYKNWDAIKAKTIEIWNAITAWISAAWNKIYATVAGWIALVWAAIVSYMNTILAFWTGVWNGLITAVMWVWNLIVTAVTTYINMVMLIITTILNIIKGVWTAIWGLFGPIVVAVFGLIKAVIGLGMALIMFVINTAMNFIKAVWSASWNFIKNAASVAWAFIVMIIRTYVNAVRTVVFAVINAVKTFMSAAWNFIKGVTSSAWNAVRNAVSGPLSAIWSKVTSVVGQVKSAISGAWASVKSATSSAWNALSGIVGSAISAFMAKVTGIKGKITSAFSGAASWLISAGKNIIQGLISGITSMISSVTSKLKSLTNLIPKSKGPAARDKVLLEENGQLIMEGLMNGIESKIKPLQGMLKGITLQIPDSVALPNTAKAGGAGQAADLTAALQAMQNGSGPLVGGDLVLQAAQGQSVESQFDSVMFRLRTTKGASR